jgi:hypothetical protein
MEKTSGSDLKSQYAGMVISLWRSDDGGSFDGGCFQRLVAAIGTECSDFLYNIEAGLISGAAEGGVLAVKEGLCAEADEEL